MLKVLSFFVCNLQYFTKYLKKRLKNVLFHKIWVEKQTFPVIIYILWDVPVQNMTENNVGLKFIDSDLFGFISIYFTIIHFVVFIVWNCFFLSWVFVTMCGSGVSQKSMLEFKSLFSLIIYSKLIFHHIFWIYCSQTEAFDSCFIPVRFDRTCPALSFY